MYYTYLVKCADQTYYCGYTPNLKARIVEHNTSKKGAKYTLARRPVKLVYYEEFITKSLAMRREIEIKKLTRRKKDLLVETHQM